MSASGEIRRVRNASTKGTHLLEPVAVGSDEFEDTAAEFARSVQIVSPLPDETLGLTATPSPATPNARPSLVPWLESYNTCRRTARSAAFRRSAPVTSEAEELGARGVELVPPRPEGVAVAVVAGHRRPRIVAWTGWPR